MEATPSWISAASWSPQRSTPSRQRRASTKCACQSAPSHTWMWNGSSFRRLASSPSRTILELHLQVSHPQVSAYQNPDSIWALTFQDRKEESHGTKPGRLLLTKCHQQPRRRDSILSGTSRWLIQVPQGTGMLHWLSRHLPGARLRHHLQDTRPRWQSWSR